MMLASVLLSQLLDYPLHFYNAFTVEAAISCSLEAFSVIATYVVSIGPFLRHASGYIATACVSRGQYATLGLRPSFS